MTACSLHVEIFLTTLVSNLFGSLISSPYKSNVFDVPTILPGWREKNNRINDALSCLESSNYYVALPPRCQWVYLGWDVETSSGQERIRQRENGYSIVLISLR
jgi:hypothetical protein